VVLLPPPKKSLVAPKAVPPTAPAATACAATEPRPLPALPEAAGAGASAAGLLAGLPSGSLGCWAGALG
jgi:hypothetical protein